MRFFPGSLRFVQTIEASAVLQARARGIRDELAGELAVALSNSVGRDVTDRDARLAAALLVATWADALIEAHRTYRQKLNARAAKAIFLATIDQGSVGVKAAMAGTPYG